MALPDDAKYSWGQWRAVLVLGRRGRRCVLHPPPAARDPQFTAASEKGESRASVYAAAAQPLARRAARHLLRLHRRCLNGFREPGPGLRQGIGLPADITLWLVVVANVVALFTQPMFGKLADRIGRKPVFIYGPGVGRLMPFYMLLHESDDNQGHLRAGRRHLLVRLRRRQRGVAGRSTARCSPPKSASPAWRSAPSSAS